MRRNYSRPQYTTLNGSTIAYGTVVDLFGVDCDTKVASLAASYFHDIGGNYVGKYDPGYYNMPKYRISENQALINTQNLYCP